MQLLLFRHGPAEERSASGSDFDRELTPDGIKRTTLAAQGLATIADRPDVILTSPKLRAAQTAAIAGNAFNLEPVLCEPIADGSAADIRDALRDRKEDAVMIVGHEPTMSQLIALLMGVRAQHGAFDLKKAGAALLDTPLHPNDPDGSATLRWLITPNVLRRLAK